MENLINKRKEIHGIQMLRALAAFMVLLHHTLEVSHGANQPGDSKVVSWFDIVGASGVDIFFVISGFIMIYTSFNDNSSISPIRFLKKRIFRIYPLYWLCCLGVVLIMSLGFLANKELEFGSIVRSIFLVPSEHDIVFVAWTLKLEMYFYFLFSLTLLLKSKLTSVIITSSFLILFFWLSDSIQSVLMHKFFSQPIVFEFILGMILGYIFSSTKFVGLPFWCGILALVFICFSPSFVNLKFGNVFPDWPRVIFWGFPSLVICSAFLKIKEPKRWLTKFFSFSGDASYSLYLTHIFVMMGYGLLLKATLLQDYDQIFIIPIVVVVALLIAFATHLLFERPVNNLIYKVTGR